VNDPRRKTPPVAFTDVNYEDAGDAGKLTIAGKGDPGAHLLLFFDNDPLGQVEIGEDGTWKFESDRKMGSGQHMFRADRLDDKNGVVIGRASITVARMDQKK
jgi:VCBS repeat-containing protein